MTPTSCCVFRMKRLPRGAFITPTSSPFTNPARPMTARPTSPWSFWKANPSVRRSRGGARLPVPEVAEILQQAARGLNAAHKLGIIHRDLKPDNIFLTYPDDESVARVSPPANAPVSPTGGATVSPPANVQVKIVDFGIAKLRESGAHTQTGMVLGTPAYMSFEQASGMRSDELDARSDIYSLGVVVYEMLTGRTPFHSDTPVGYLRMHMQEDPPPFRAVKPDLPALPQLESVVMKALTKDRNQRYGSVLEFAREFMAAAQPSPRAEAPVPPASTRIVSPPAAAKPPQFRTVPVPPRQDEVRRHCGGCADRFRCRDLVFIAGKGEEKGRVLVRQNRRSQGGREGQSQGRAKVRVDSTGQLSNGLLAGRHRVHCQRETAPSCDHHQRLLAGADGSARGGVQTFRGRHRNSRARRSRPQPNTYLN